MFSETYNFENDFGSNEFVDLNYDSFMELENENSFLNNNTINNENESFLWNDNKNNKTTGYENDFNIWGDNKDGDKIEYKRKGKILYGELSPKNYGWTCNLHMDTGENLKEERLEISAEPLEDRSNKNEFKTTIIASEVFKEHKVKRNEIFRILKRNLEIDISQNGNVGTEVNKLIKSKFGSFN